MRHLQFDNRFVSELPEDSEIGNFRRQVHGACYSRVTPCPAPNPQLLAYSAEVTETFGLTPEDCLSNEFLEVFCGNRLLPGMTPHAACYGGHQFGQWAGQLGDGRAINLGEAVTRQKNTLMLQLKGAGPTPYSRSADGYAVLRSSIREFLCSEAMHHLGVPTTRAMSLIQTGRRVIRDMLYDGNPRAEPGAVVCRVAPSFIRFGNFELFASRNDTTNLVKLIDFTIRNHFPELGNPSPEVYRDWFNQVCLRTANMIVHWQRVGFVHGVMNTDNMSIHGLTIDYGPYGWLDDYDPGWTPNTTDASGRRYCFGNQPQIAYWNLVKLANALYSAFGDTAPLESGLETYTQAFEQGWQEMMANKLGLSHFDEGLVNELLSLLSEVETDMTLFYRRLATISSNQFDSESSTLPPQLHDAWYAPDELTDDYRYRMVKWLQTLCARVKQEDEQPDHRTERMNAINPNYVLRNYLAQEAIDLAQSGDPRRINELLELLRRPYDDQVDKSSFAKKRPDWARSRVGCSMLSCSS